MRYVASYLLAALGGNADPKVEDIESICSAVGVHTDADAAKHVVSCIHGKNVDELIAQGASKLVSVSGRGARATAAVPAAPAVESKPAKKEEPKEESDDDMGFGLFD